MTPKTNQSVYGLLLLIHLFFISLSEPIYAQSNMCGLDASMQLQKTKNTDYGEYLLSIEHKMVQWQKKRGKGMKSAVNGAFRIPVVFHVITHSSNASSLSQLYQNYNGAPNTYSRIEAQLDRLNTEFSGAGIQFCLAQNAPPAFEGVNGTPGSWQVINNTVSKGVTYHINDALSSLKISDAANIPTLETLLPFNQNQSYNYLDIYIVDNVINASNVSIQGEASFGVGFPFDDVVVKSTTVGDVSNGTSTTFVNSGTEQGKVAVHEIGHWLLLHHTFNCDQACPSSSPACGSSSLGYQGDYVNDTPPQSQRYNSSFGSCPSINPLLSCNGSDLIYFNNHMNYSGDL